MSERIKLTEIDLQKLVLVKETFVEHDQQDHSRWIFKSKELIDGKNEIFIKIWNPTYVRRDNILKAIDAGFYDQQTTPALNSLIFHNGFCRGYLMDKCIPVRSLTLDKRFYNLIKEKSDRTGFFNIQFSPGHVMKYKTWFSLIDLEGVFPIKDLPYANKIKCYFDYRNYENFIIDQYIKKFPKLGNELSRNNITHNDYFKEIPSILRFNQSILKSLTSKATPVVGQHIGMIKY